MILLAFLVSLAFAAPSKPSIKDRCYENCDLTYSLHLLDEFNGPRNCIAGCDILVSELKSHSYESSVGRCLKQCEVDFTGSEVVACQNGCNSDVNAPDYLSVRMQNMMRQMMNRINSMTSSIGIPDSTFNIGDFMPMIGGMPAGQTSESRIVRFKIDEQGRRVAITDLTRNDNGVTVKEHFEDVLGEGDVFPPRHEIPPPPPEMPARGIFVRNEDDTPPQRVETDRMDDDDEDDWINRVTGGKCHFHRRHRRLVMLLALAMALMLVMALALCCIRRRRRLAEERRQIAMASDLVWTVDKKPSPPPSYCSAEELAEKKEPIIIEAQVREDDEAPLTATPPRYNLI